jgi:hypothetical protein
MYLYIEAEIDGQKFSLTSQVMGTSKAAKITYTLYPTTVFLEDDEIVCESVEEDFNGERNLCFLNKTTDGTSDFYSDVKDSKYHRGLILKLEEAAKEDNETIERFQQLNNGLDREVAELTAKNESLKQDLKECKIWITQLEESNKQQADLLGKQQAAISKALDEANQAAMLRNEATIKLAQQKIAIRIAIDNFNLATKDI